MSGKILTPTVVALGYFDSVHIGHRKVLEEAKKLADSLSASLTVFTFDGNLRAALSLKGDKFVYSLNERKEIFRELGIENVYVQPVDFNFLSTGKLAFLNKLNKKMNIVGYVCGEDYKFGKFAKGTVEDLAKFAETENQKLLVVETLSVGDKRVSSSRIKTLLAAGDIKGANELLGRPFSYTSKVVHGKGVGTSLGFPTANFKLEKGKQPLKLGVYGGRAIVDGKEYKAVINFGASPTFNGTEPLIEAHIIGLSGEQYDKIITLFFDSYIREIRKFYNENELKKQLESDVNFVKGGE